MMRVLILCLLSVAGITGKARGGDLRLLVQGPGGEFLREAAAVARTQGYVWTAREALYGAASAAVIDTTGNLHRVWWVTSDDPDLGVLELFVGAQLPPGPAPSREESPTEVLFAGQKQRILQIREAGSSGVIGHLEEPVANEPGGPVFDSNGLLAGWRLTRAVDGKTMAFAIPLRRIEMASRTVLVHVEDWGRAHNAERDEAYQTALGYFWAGNFDGAAFYFRKALEAASNNSRAWLHLGFAEGKLGRVKAKLECLRRSIELDPKLDVAHFYLGMQLLMNGDYEGAEYELDELTRLESVFAGRLELLIRSVHVDRLEPDPKRARPAKPAHGRNLV